MENKPNVFPSSPKMTDAMKQANETGTRIAEQANKEQGIIEKHKTQGELDAQAKMEKDTLDRLEQQLKLRDELIAKRKAEAEGKDVEVPNPEQPKVVYSKPESTPHKKIELSDDEKYEVLSKPQENVPYDLIKLPSEGLLYKNGKSALKVAYLNAMDENIITNPNLLQSGKFLEILLNRKILDNIRYRDLHIGDRNAIMVWLRSTGYGPNYKVKLSDPNTEEYTEFEVEIDLSKLGIKNLSEKPDENGHFKYKLPLSQKEITFKLLTVGDIEDIEDYLEITAKEVGPEFTNGSTVTLLKQILAVDGNYDSETVKEFVEKGMRIGDVRAFRKYVNEIESGVDMNITVETPGGGSLDTFLPLNLSFFWPDLGI